MATVAQFDETYFSKTGAKFITIDEESSGIIDITEVMPNKKDGKTYFLLNAQIHSTLMKARPDLIIRSAGMQTKLENIALEGGQYYLMSVGNWDSIFKS
jgi:hypothetical protein